MSPEIAIKFIPNIDSTKAIDFDARSAERSPSTSSPYFEVKFLHKNATLPKKDTSDSAGYDV